MRRYLVTFFVLSALMLMLTTASIGKVVVLGSQGSVDKTGKLFDVNHQKATDRISVKKDRPVAADLQLDAVSKEIVASMPAFSPVGADGIEYIIQYDDGDSYYYSGRPVPGDTCGVWFEPPTESKLVSGLFLFNPGMGGTANVYVWELKADFDPYLYYDNDESGASPGPSPFEKVLAGPIPITFSAEGAWEEVVFADYGYTDIDVGTKNFFVGYVLQPGQADTYYPSILGDVQDDKPYHSICALTNPGGQLGSGYEDHKYWCAYGIDWFIRAKVDMYGDPPPVVKGLVDLSDTYTAGPYDFELVVTDMDQTGVPNSGVVTSVQLIYSVDGVIDTLNMTVSDDSVFTAAIPAVPAGSLINYRVEATDNADHMSIVPNIAGYNFTYRQPSDATILLINDSGRDSEVDVYFDILDAAGFLYDYWYTSESGDPGADVLDNSIYSTIILYQGSGNSGMLPVDTDADDGVFDDAHAGTPIVNFLDGGGNLFLTSSDYLGAAFNPSVWTEFMAPDGSFMKDYLHVADGWSDSHLNENGTASMDTMFIGVAGDPISGDLSSAYFEVNPTLLYGITNWTDFIYPTDDATTIFTTEIDEEGAGLSFSGTYKLVFLPWLFEAMVNADLQNTLMLNVLAFFGEKAAPLVTIESGPRYVVAANSGPYPVVATATDGDGTVTGVELGTSTDGLTYTYSAMTANGDVYEGEIPALNVGDTLFFQIKATDNDGLIGYAGPWGFTMIDFTPTNTALLYCGDEPYYMVYYTLNIDSIMIASLDRISAVYDAYDVDAYGPPSYIGFLDQYESVIWHAYADWTGNFPENTSDNPLAPFVANNGNLLFSSEESIAPSHYDDGDYSPVPGDAAYDVLGISWVMYDVGYDTIKVMTDDLTTNMSTSDIQLAAGPLAAFGSSYAYMNELIDPVYYGDFRNTYLLDAWLPQWGVWYSDWNCGISWKENLGTKRVIVPFPLAFIDDTNRDAFLTNVIAWFGTENAIDPAVETLPKAFALKQNFPNPFNPVTSIAFEMPAAQDVRLNVYNMLGQKVRTLVNDHRAAGRYTVLWDGRDDSGHMVGSGVYFYQIQAGSFSKTAKMVFLK